MSPTEVLQAIARVLVRLINARCAVAAWQRAALIDICCTVDSFEAGHTRTRVRAYRFDARCAVCTGLRVALIDIASTVGSSVPDFTSARVDIRTVCRGAAAAAVLTWLAQTFVHIDIAVEPRVSVHAST